MNKRKLNEIISTIGTTICKKPKNNETSKIINNNNNKNHKNHRNYHDNNNININKNKKPCYTPSKIPVPLRKEQVPKRIRELVWNTYNGDKYSSECYVGWCHNIINVFNFQVGHDVPESKGGTLEISNLRPICGNCNLSMGNKYTITEWSDLVQPVTLPKPDIEILNQSSEQPKDQPSNKLPISHDLEKSMKKLLKKTIIELENTQQQLPDTIPNDTNSTLPGLATPAKYKLIAALGMVIMVLNLFV